MADPAVVVGTLNKVVGTWGLVSVVGGSALAASGRSQGVAAFGQQTATWGAINVAIAAFGTWRSRYRTPSASGLRTLLLVNSVLDIGYVAVGAAIASGKLSWDGRIPSHAAAGHGSAVMVQGAALAAIDTVAVVALRTR